MWIAADSLEAVTSAMSTLGAAESEAALSVSQPYEVDALPIEQIERKKAIERQISSRYPFPLPQVHPQPGDGTTGSVREMQMSSGPDPDPETL